MVMEVRTKFFPQQKVNKYSKENNTMYLTESLFADHTTVIGKACEIDEATQVIKESLAFLEKRTNDAKEERARLGTMEANNIRMLGVYLGRKEDISQRLRRGALIFARTRKRFTKSRLREQRL